MENAAKRPDERSETFYWSWQLRHDSVTRDTGFMMSFGEVN